MPPTQGARRLRQTLSNPDPPAEEQAVSKKGRGSRRSQGKATGRGCPPNKLKKTEAGELTVVNILGGVVQQPRVVLSWRRMSAQASMKTSAASDTFKEQKELDRLQAAINLLPEENPGLGDTDHRESLALALEAVSAQELPWPTVKVLLRRAAAVNMEHKDAEGFCQVVWPWSGSTAASRAAESTPDASTVSTTTVSCAAPPKTFDPFHPRLCKLDSTTTSREERSEFAFELVVKEYLATLMMAKGSRVQELVAVAAAFSRLPAPPADATAKEKHDHELVVTTTSALAAMVQDTVCTTAQIAALRQISLSGDDKAAVVHANKATKALDIFLQDTWWQEKLSTAWARAADEGVAAPQMERVIQALKLDTSDVHSDAAEEGSIASSHAAREEVVQAWELAMRKFAGWQRTLREGATTPMLKAMHDQVCRDIEHLTSDGAVHEKNSEDWLSSCRLVRERVDWLRMNGDGKIAAMLDSLDTVFNERAAASQLNKGMRLIEAYASHDPEDQAGLESMVSEMQSVFASCKGLTVGNEQEESLRAWLQHATDTTMTEALAILAASIADLVPEGGDSPWLTREAWIVTARAMSVAACAAEVTGASNSSESTTGDLLARATSALQSCSSDLASSHVACPQGLKGLFGSNSEGIQELVGAVEAWVTEKLTMKLKKQEKVLQEAVDSLSDVAGGRSSKLSWKGSLTPSVSWDEVAREAAYHLVDKCGVTMHEHLDVLFKAVEGARAKYTLMLSDLVSSQVARRPDSLNCAMPEPLAAQLAAASMQARITHTESFFFMVLNQSSPDRARKIQKRIESMSTHGITSEDIQPAMWHKALQLTSSRKHTSPATPRTTQTPTKKPQK